MATDAERDSRSIWARPLYGIWWLAHRAGSADACLEVGSIHAHGHLGRPVDVEAALAAFDKGARRGDTRCMVNYACLVIGGVGPAPLPTPTITPERQAQALAYLHQAAAADDPFGLAWLGDCYAKGLLGAPIDLERAHLCFLACVDRVDFVRDALAYHYWHGDVVPRDRELAERIRCAEPDSDLLRELAATAPPAADIADPATEPGYHRMHWPGGRTLGGL